MQYSLTGGCLAILIASCILAPEGPTEEEKVEFAPVLEKISLEATEAPPGAQVGVIYFFRNRGSTPSAIPYRVFVHFEREPSCEAIPFQQDHEPSVPTTTWRPGREICDGPHQITIPVDASEGEYFIHIGLFDPTKGPRCYETYLTEKLNVSRQAPRRQLKPKLSEDELSQRRGRLREFVSDAISCDNEFLKLELSRTNGRFAVLDKSTGVRWYSNPFQSRFCTFTAARNGKTTLFDVDSFRSATTHGQRIELMYELPDKHSPSIQFTLSLLDDEPGLELSYDVAENNGWEIESVRLLDECLWTTDADDGYVAVPFWLGFVLSADSGLMYTRRYKTFSWTGLAMQMLGVAKEGATCLLSWNNPYVTMEVKSFTMDVPSVPGRQMLSVSAILGETAKKMFVRFCGKGGYVEIAKAYRELAMAGPYYKPWSKKLKEHPSQQRLFGAPDFKPFVLSRTIKGSRFFKGPGEERVSLNYTFDEAARIAEHLHNDLGIDRGLYVLAGWIHRGYDNQHPDILPAAPECGGNEGLKNASERIRKLGYLFGLHDNYQDMYRDAPSWNEDYIMKRPDGSLTKGGNWAGGQAWLTCSKKALELARRPDTNLATVKKLFSPTAYFIDTTFAAGLYECFDPAHPLKQQDDIRYKSDLADYALELFGVFGSEFGREWAVPHASYFEGILSQWKWDEVTRSLGYGVPLFELVYRDCVALYTHQGDRAGPNDADYIIHHLSIGRMPLYRFGPHIYWETERPPPRIVRISPSVADFAATGARTFDITYSWQVEDRLDADVFCFVHFTDANGTIKSQNDHKLDPPVTQWRKGDTVRDGPHTVTVPEEMTGQFELRIGLAGSAGRVPLAAADDGDTRYTIGRLNITKKGIHFSECPLQEEPKPFDSFSHGWDGQLCRTDAFIKNTYEFLSPVNELTAMLPMTQHRFLTADQTVILTEFGNRFVTIVTNAGAQPYEYEGATLPPFGFVVDSPVFVAYHALNRGAINYDAPTLITIRSLDGRPLSESQKIRLYRAFGGKRTAIKRADGRWHEVELDHEAVVSP